MIKSFKKVLDKEKVYTITDFTDYKKNIHLDVYSGLTNGLSFNKVNISMKSKPVNVFTDNGKVFLFCEDNYLYLLEDGNTILLTKIKFTSPIKIEYLGDIDKIIVYDQDRVYFIGSNLATLSVPTYTYGFYLNGRLYLVSDDKIYLNGNPNGYECIINENAADYIKVSAKYGKILYASGYENGVEVVTEQYRLRYETGFDNAEFYLKSEEKLSNLVTEDTVIKVEDKTIYFSAGKLFDLDGNELFKLPDGATVAGQVKGYDNYYLLPVVVSKDALILAYSTKDRKGYFLSHTGNFFGGYLLDDKNLRVIGSKNSSASTTWVSKTIKLSNYNPVVLRRVGVSGSGIADVKITGKEDYFTIDVRIKKPLRTNIKSREFTIEVAGRNINLNRIELYYIE